ncbi:MAG TPA: sigma factor-like helix-turn-helix DNA-binding protein [Solirubrobacteraceae bacterium]|jgi:hypothetical protein
MSRLDDLPPDQRAVLLLLVQQGKSHAEIADMLAIPESAVRDRAHAALDALTKDTPSTERPTTSTPRRGQEPETPALPPPRARRPPPSPRPPRGSDAPSSSQTARARRTGALLLGAILVAIVVVVVVLSSSGGSSHKSSATGTTTTSGSKTTTAAGEPHIDKQLNLVSPDPTSKAVGIVEVLSEGSKRAFLVTAEHLPPTENGFFYAAWLYNSPSEARVLGRAPNVSSNGRLQAVGALPANAGKFRQMLITKETSAKPSHPGPIVLNGPFSLS